MTVTFQSRSCLFRKALAFEGKNCSAFTRTPLNLDSCSDRGNNVCFRKGLPHQGHGFEPCTMQRGKISDRFFLQCLDCLFDPLGRTLSQVKAPNDGMNLLVSPQLLCVINGINNPGMGATGDNDKPLFL